MDSVIDYVLSNYVWILGVAIIILLAIIGSYADKTNFGQGNQKTESKVKDDINQEIDDKSLKKSKKKNKNKNEVEKIADESVKDNVPSEGASLNPEVNNRDEILENSYNELEQEFNEILPEKDLIDDDFMSDIDNLFLDKTQKIDKKDLPSLDDLDLPKIKNFKKQNVDENIWKL